MQGLGIMGYGLGTSDKHYRAAPSQGTGSAEAMPVPMGKSSLAFFSAKHKNGFGLLIAWAACLPR
jgi:hypothetical protein